MENVNNLNPGAPLQEIWNYDKHLVNNYRERHEVRLRRRKWWLYDGNRRKDKWFHWKRPNDMLSAGTRRQKNRLRRLRRSKKIKRGGYLWDWTHFNAQAAVKRSCFWSLKQYLAMVRMDAQNKSEEEISDDEAMTEDEDLN